VICRLERPIDLTASHDRVIAIGYGNTLRSDDGAGQKLAQILQSWHLPQIRSLCVHQLTPELAAELATAELAIFMDVYYVSNRSAANDLLVIPIDPATYGQYPSTRGAGHTADPHSLLYLTDLVYGKTPTAWWILIPAVNFEFGEQLSPLTTTGIVKASQQIQQIISTSMHELSLMESTLEIALECAQKQGARKIHQVSLRVGAISGVVPEALEFAFDVCTQNSIAADAKLQIELVPALCYCQDCDREFSPPDFIYTCPQCGKISSKLLQGRELQLISLEVS
jgi:hydrogenase nickel incorporation protein HypA/HybF